MKKAATRPQSPRRTGTAGAKTEEKAPATKTRKKPAAKEKTPRPGPGRPPKWTPEAIAEEGAALLAWLAKKDRKGKFLNWWLKDFAHERGYSAQRYSEWSDPNDAHYSEEFSEAYKIGKEIQESRLLKLGLGLKNASMAILALKNTAGWRDKSETSSEVTFTQKEPRQMTDEELVAALAEEDARERAAAARETTDGKKGRK
jgi:hypothetical protein